jgi:hypothetical protein
MTFWDSFGDTVVLSQVDQVLQQASFQLEELLDLDDVLQETASHNPTLMN